MKIIVKWTQTGPVPIVALSIDPVHNQLIVGIGKTIVFFKEMHDTLRFSLRLISNLNEEVNTG